MDLQLRLASAKRHATPLVWCHIWVFLIVVLTALVSRDPAKLVLTGPSLALLGFGFAFGRPVGFDVDSTIDRPSGVEGDVIEMTSHVTAQNFIAHCDLEVEVPPELPPVTPLRVAGLCAPGVPTSLGVKLELARWGIRSPSAVVVRATDALGMFTTLRRYTLDERIKVHLPDPATRSLLNPARYLRVVGNHTSSALGDGCEAADFREYRPGDRLRDINWRISARRDEEWITQRHPDRATTIVVILEAVEDVGLEPDSSLRRSVRAASAVAQSHLKVNDPVGLMIVGRAQRWIAPQIGNRQRDLIAESLLDIQSNRMPRESLRPRDMIPRDSVVVAVSSLGRLAALRQESTGLLTILRGLRRRGQTVNVIDPEIAFGPLPEDRDELHAWARRMLSIDHELLRRELREEGLGVVPWGAGQAIEPVLSAFHTFHTSREAKVM